MKKLLLITLAFCSIAVASAQKFNVTTASIAIRTYQSPQSNEYDRKAAIDEGKEAIDKASINPETQGSAEMWYNRGVIYQLIVSDTTLGLSKKIPDALDIAREAFVNAIKMDDKKMKFAAPARQNLTGFVASMVNYNATLAYNKREYPKAIAEFKKLLEILPYDTEKQMITQNISDKEVYYNMAVAALNAEMMKEAREYLQVCIDKGYNEPTVYQNLSALYLKDGDTTNAMKIIDQGRSMFPSHSGLIIDEINIYIARHQVDVLVNKLNGAIESNPDNSAYYYVRGHSYQSMASENKERQKILDDTIAYFTKQIKGTADPKKKAAWQAKSNTFKVESDKLKAESSDFLAKSEKDYLKTIELDNTQSDAQFNLGALYLSMASPLTEKMNNIPISAEKEYNDTKAKRDELYKKSLVYFENALQYVKDPREEYKIVGTLRQVYGQLGNMEKSNEMKKREAELKAKQKSK